MGVQGARSRCAHSRCGVHDIDILVGVLHSWDKHVDVALPPQGPCVCVCDSVEGDSIGKVNPFLAHKVLARPALACFGQVLVSREGGQGARPAGRLRR